MFDEDTVVDLVDEQPTRQRALPPPQPQYTDLGWVQRGPNVVWQRKLADGRVIDMQIVWAPPCGGARVYDSRGALLGRRQCQNRCKQMKVDCGPGNITPYFYWGCGECIEYERERIGRRRYDGAA